MSLEVVSAEVDPERGVVDFSSDDIGFSAVGLGHVMLAARVDF